MLWEQVADVETQMIIVPEFSTRVVLAIDGQAGAFIACRPDSLTFWLSLSGSSERVCPARPTQLPFFV